MKKTTRRRADSGFAIAPVLYMLTLVGVGAGALFSSYFQTLRSNVQVTNAMIAKNELQAATTSLAATAVAGTGGELCPGGGAGASPNCTGATNYAAKLLAFSGATASQLPSYAGGLIANEATVRGGAAEAGVLTVASGLKQLDPWGHYYVFCRWESSSAAPGDPALMMISAGANGTLSTICNDTAAQGDDQIVRVTVAQAQERAAVWQKTGSGAEYGAPGSKVTVDNSGNVSIAGTLGVTGTSTLGAVNAGAITGSGYSGGAISGTSGSFSSGLDVTSGALNLHSGGITNLGAIAGGTTAAFSGAITGGGYSGGAISGTTGAFSGDFAVATDKFTVAATSGNTSIGGTLGVTGASTLAGLSATTGAFSGDLDVGSGNFTVASATGNTSVAGTLGVTGATSLAGLSATTGAFSGDLNVGSGSFTVAAASGNTSIAGTLGVTGASTLGTLSAGATSLSGALDLNGNGIADLGSIAGGTNATFSGTVTAASFSGNLSGNVSGDGSGLTDINADNITSGTLSVNRLGANSIDSSKMTNTGVTAGAYNWGTVDAAGRVTAAQDVPVGTPDSIDDGAGESITTNSGSHSITFSTNNSTAMTLDSNGYLGLLTTTPTNILSLGGNAARTMWMERHTTANTAGNNLTVQAGGATSGATDKAGGNLVLSSGTATGTGSSSISFQTASAGSTGTSDNAPATHMTLDGNGSLLVSGTYSGTASPPTSGAGTRMFFDVKNAAFRAGGVSGTQWDSGNEGSYSFASGYNNKANGPYSAAMGSGNTASGNYSFAMGSGNTSSADGSVALGIGSTASGNKSFAAGEGANASSGQDVAIGSLINATGGYSTAIGFNSWATGGSSRVLGTSSSASGTASMALGHTVGASGTYSTALGYAVTAGSGSAGDSTGDYSMAIGLRNSATGTTPKVTGDGSLGIFMGDQNGVTVSSNNVMAVMGGNVGLGTVAPTNLLSLGGTAARTIWMERHTTSNTAGNNLTVQAGGATSGATDKNGGSLILSGGTATGTGSSSVQFQTATTGSTGTTDNSPTTKMTLSGYGSLTLTDGRGATANLNSADATATTTGQGTRMMFDAGKAAFRTGYVSSTNWNSANVGQYSFASGYDTKASGTYSVAMGYRTSATGEGSVALGYGSTASGSRSTALGFNTTASGEYSFAAGSSSVSSSYASTALGWSTTASNEGALASGENSIASGYYSTAIGHYASTSGEASLALGRKVTVGDGNIFSGRGAASIGMGLGNATGTYPKVTGAGSLGIFMGDQSGVNLSSDNVMAVMGGKVGIGTVSPQATLDVNGYLRLSKNNSQPIACAAGNDGAIALTSQYTLCVCKGGSTSWVQTTDGTTACTW